jgi:hypothetical protein
MSLRNMIVASLAALSLATTILPSTAAVWRDVLGAGAVPEASLIDRVGCYRWGETGYHWYRFCLGPSWLYPHHCRWRHGYRVCW